MVSLSLLFNLMHLLISFDLLLPLLRLFGGEGARNTLISY
jgi:hypothetical protein